MPVEWNKAKRIFERDGKPIPPASVKQFILETVENAKSRIEAIAKGYTSHRNTAEFYTSMRDEIRNMHTALAMVAQGGREQMTQAVWGATGSRIKSELTYLRGFERDIANGTQSDAQIIARAIQYASAGYVTYQQSVLAREKGAGILFVEWTVDESAENCAGCLEAAGIHPIDDVPVFGSHECNSNCRCDLTYLDENDVAQAA